MPAQKEPLTAREVREYAQGVGLGVGLSSYLDVIVGAACKGLIDPDADDYGGLFFLGFGIALCVTTILGAVISWRMNYRGRSFRIASGPNAIAGATMGVAAGVTGIVSAILAMCYALMLFAAYAAAGGFLVIIILFR